MQIYKNIPDTLVESWFKDIGWEKCLESPPITGVTRRVGFHCHDVEEWLQVTSGTVTFISAGGMKYPLGDGDVLQIPRGEVHDVEIPAGGVKYLMWVPVMPDPWQHDLTDDIALIEQNLAVPVHEDNGNAQFFVDFLSEHLTFRTMKGQVLDKERFLLRGFQNQNRQPSDCVIVLHKSDEDILLSNVVTLPSPDGPQSITNLRLFVRGKGGSKCRVWLNYLEPGAKDANARGGMP